MQKWIARLRWLAAGSVTLGVLGAVNDVNFNQIWYSFLTTILNLIVSIFFGGTTAADLTA